MKGDKPNWFSSTYTPDNHSEEEMRRIETTCPNGYTNHSPDTYYTCIPGVCMGMGRVQRRVPSRIESGIVGAWQMIKRPLSRA